MTEGAAIAVLWRKRHKLFNSRALSLSAGTRLRMRLSSAMALDREISMLRDWLWSFLGIPKLSEKTLGEIIEYSVRSSSQLNNEILSELALVAGEEPYDVIKWHQKRVEEEGIKFPVRPTITDR
jgi:hypothetical protein